ncbi:uncharacterized protein NFIA_095030 [Aspergillus fischeri NRRL 181]|uniref:Uncharacterized protein n=1 Tax=Neosartorya fischeri (strain ATCC 1020 / DSM 3700 / CBS 544.65 / FGSC A1164 / JCM 1740 / NRRL 181 / WB 181) TaxID=331117 RepID=A1DAJ3_NEOFI|nr:uncharacterized protein NFIA_095030 [Aspergillus fischeri NRRL 181]EAW19883.1 hypothetical protein NFIA_095030 [Aspergillus fischeri NRRL 181]KAG2009375.1 hypothetical protein GB937_007778 [Aspergillus fischeri]
MSDHIIKTLRFEGKAEGWFDPPPQPLNVQREYLFSAVRMTITGAADKRNHDIRVSLTSKPNDDHVNGIFAVVPDKEPSTKGAWSLSRLLPDSAYNVHFSAGGFSDDEHVLIIVELLKLDSTVAAVTRNILRDTEAGDNSVNALTFGFSEASFAHLMVPPSSLPEVEVGPVPFLKVRLSMESLEFPWYPMVYIDVAAEELVIAGNLQLAFYRTTDPAQFPEPVAVVLVQVSVRCRPAMATMTEEILELHFVCAKLLGSISVNVRDPSAETGVAGGFGSVVEFEKSVNDYITQITSKSGELGFALPAYLESRPLPDYWHRVLNMRLEFLRFQYKTVQVHGRPISYLFLVFSMSSLNLPPPCYCEQPSLTQAASETDDSSMPTVFEALQQQAKYGRLLPKKWSKTVTENRTDYTDILGAAQVAAFGMSQKAFREIAKLYANFGSDQSSSTSADGAIYASVRFWYRVSLDTAKIREDGIEAVIDLAGEGSAKAAVRDRCGHDVLRASVSLRLTLQNNSITWRPYISVNNTDPAEMTIAAVADARVGDPDVDFDFVGGPPAPVDQVIDWVLTQLTEGTKNSLGKIASDQLTIRLVRTLEDNGKIRLRFAANEFFEDEAFVLLGQLWSQNWR